MSKLIVICGLPGTGKTTLADTLSKRLKITCISKDAIKEALYDELGLKNLEDSLAIGKRSIEVMLNLAEKNVQLQKNVIIEAPFRFEEDYQLFSKWIQQYKVDFTAIICTVSPEIRENRFYNRPRHEAHHDNERKFEEQTEDIYHKLPGKQLWIDTNKPVSNIIDEMIDQIY